MIMTVIFYSVTVFSDSKKLWVTSFSYVFYLCVNLKVAKNRVTAAKFY